MPLALVGIIEVCSRKAGGGWPEGGGRIGRPGQHANPKRRKAAVSRRVVDLMHRRRDDASQSKKTNQEELHGKRAACPCGLEVNRDPECA